MDADSAHSASSPSSLQWSASMSPEEKTSQNTADRAALAVQGHENEEGTLSSSSPCTGVHELGRVSKFQAPPMDDREDT